MPNIAIQKLEKDFFAALKPLPTLTISEWADEYRMLSREDSAEPGKWKTSRAEYQREIMDSISDPTVEDVVFMKGSQVGWTAMIGNVVGYYGHQDPAPILIIQPTVEMAEAWSKERLAPMIRDTPVLVELFTDPKSRDSHNTLRMKQFPGGYVAIIGSNAPASLASRPIRIVLGDEVDRYPVSAGTEGDPLKLASKRQSTFWNRKRLIGSTPTTKNESVIEREYDISDKRKYNVACPHCDEYQVLSWSQVKWDKTEEGNHIPNTAHYQCLHCGVLLDDGERWKMIATGKWVATAPFHGVAGFHLSQLYSPWVALSSMVKEFVEAQGKPALLKVFTNTVLGESWEEKGEAVDGAGLQSHCEQYGPSDLPEGVHYATAGVDVQGDRLEIEVVGWGDGDESWGIMYDVLYGDPAQQKVWDDLDAILKDKFWTAEGRLVRVRSACIDTGGHHAAQVISFCNKRIERKIYPIKGASGVRPIWPKRASKSTNTNQNLWLIGVDTAKDAVYGRFKIELKGSGYCHLPLDYDDDWFKQVTSEKVITRYKDGRPYRIWILDNGKRNEALDCRVYATAAKESLSQVEKRPSVVRTESMSNNKEEKKNAVLKTVQDQSSLQHTQRRMRSRGI